MRRNDDQNRVGILAYNARGAPTAGAVREPPLREGIAFPPERAFPKDPEGEGRKEALLKRIPNQFFRLRFSPRLRFEQHHVEAADG